MRVDIKWISNDSGFNELGEVYRGKIFKNIPQHIADRYIKNKTAKLVTDEKPKPKTSKDNKES